MKKYIIMAMLASFNSYAQTNYGSTSLVDTNSNSTVTNNSTVNSNNVNTNINNGNMTYNNVQSGTLTNINQNNNVNSGTMTYNNNNVNASTNTNVNHNVQSGEITNRNLNESTITQRIVQPPPTAIAPAMMSMGTDLCVTGISGATQTQILGISFGATLRDYNCERLKLSKTLYDMGMKVAAVATLCQDRRIFDAMMQAGTPCPYEGKIGEAAKLAWEQNPHKIPKPVKE